MASRAETRRKPYTATDYLSESFSFGGEMKSRGEIIATLTKGGATRRMIDLYLSGLEKSKRLSEREVAR